MTVPPVPGFGQVVASHVVAPQPYAGSVVDTQVPPQFLVPVPQLPTTHWPAWQTRVAPAPAVGQDEASQLVVPQPYFGSLIATQTPPHSFSGAEQVSGASTGPSGTAASIGIVMPPEPGEPPAGPPPPPWAAPPDPVTPPDPDTPPDAVAPPEPIAPPLATTPPPAPPVALPAWPPLPLASVAESTGASSPPSDPGAF